MYELQEKITELQDILIFWSLRDFAFLPAQPDSKKVVPGFGIYKNHFDDWSTASTWYQTHAAANLGVIAPESAVILDFDRVDLYAWFRAYCPASASYTEYTPRGGAHVFIYHAEAERLRRGRWLAGVECKAATLVAPSVVDGKPYRRDPHGDILDFADDLKIFEYLLLDLPGNTRVRESVILAAGKDILSKIKMRVLIPDILEEYAPKSHKTLHGRGRWLSARCPLHDDEHASFWIDTNRAIWGCHGCQGRGDVVNLYAELRRVSVQEAIKDLARRVS